MDLKSGTLCFVKIKGYSAWPARINPLPPGVTIDKGKYPVFFYGSHQIAHVHRKDISICSDEIIQNSLNKKNNKLTQAIKEMRENPTIYQYGVDKEALNYLSKLYKFKIDSSLDSRTKPPIKTNIPKKKRRVSTKSNENNEISDEKSKQISNETKYLKDDLTDLQSIIDLDDEAIHNTRSHRTRSVSINNQTKQKTNDQNSTDKETEQKLITQNIIEDNQSSAILVTDNPKVKKADIKFTDDYYALFSEILDDSESSEKTNNEIDNSNVTINTADDSIKEELKNNDKVSHMKDIENNKEIILKEKVDLDTKVIIEEIMNIEKYENKSPELTPVKSNRPVRASAQKFNNNLKQLTAGLSIKSERLNSTNSLPFKRHISKNKTNKNYEEIKRNKNSNHTKIESNKSMTTKEPLDEQLVNTIPDPGKVVADILYPEETIIPPVQQKLQMQMDQNKTKKQSKSLTSYESSDSDKGTISKVLSSPKQSSPKPPPETVECDLKEKERELRSKLSIIANEIKCSLLVGRENMNECLKVMDTLKLELDKYGKDVSILNALCQNTGIVDTIRKCRRYKNDQKIRIAANDIYEKFRVCYLNASLDEKFTAGNILLQKTNDQGDAAHLLNQLLPDLSLGSSKSEDPPTTPSTPNTPSITQHVTLPTQDSQQLIIPTQVSQSMSTPVTISSKTPTTITSLIKSTTISPKSNIPSSSINTPNFSMTPVVLKQSQTLCTKVESPCISHSVNTTSNISPSYTSSQPSMTPTSIQPLLRMPNNNTSSLPVTTSLTLTSNAFTVIPSNNHKPMLDPDQTDLNSLIKSGHLRIVDSYEDNEDDDNNLTHNES